MKIKLKPGHNMSVETIAEIIRQFSIQSEIEVDISVLAQSSANDEDNTSGRLVNGFKIHAKAQLSGAALDRANLQSADLKGADISFAYLWRANLRGANLVGANLEGAFLEEADFCGATLKNANLKDACLRRANLIGANLADADLQGANFQGALRNPDDHPIPGWEVAWGKLEKA